MQVTGVTYDTIGKSIGGKQLRIVFVTVQPFIPQTAGGAQTSTHELATEIAQRGHDVAVLAGLNSVGWIGFRNRVLIKLFRMAAPSDRKLGYETFRTWFPHRVVQDPIIPRTRPDVAVLSTWHCIPVAKAFERAGVPVVIYLRDVEFGDLGGDLRSLTNAHYIANSAFTAGAYQNAFGISATVVPPLFNPAKYRVEPSGRSVTFINPHPKKGVDIALALASACPDIPFTFVEGWALDADERAGLMEAFSVRPNISWVPRTQDMRTVYRNTKVLLAPSRWEEAWCRVVSEGQYSGIPALATNRGGLPESVGPGGCLLDADAPIADWVAALRRMWDDPAYYAAMSAAALTHAGRCELDRAMQVETVLRVLHDAASLHRAPNTSSIQPVLA